MTTLLLKEHSAKVPSEFVVLYLFQPSLIYFFLANPNLMVKVQRVSVYRLLIPKWMSASLSLILRPRQHLGESYGKVAKHLRVERSVEK